MTQPLSTQLKGKSQRSIKNFLLQPVLQLRFSIYNLVLSVIFACLICFVLYFNLVKFVGVVLDLTGVQEELKELLSQSAEPAKLQILVLTGIYIGLSAIISIKLTHSLIGPTVAFRRHIKMMAEGKYDYKTVLRSGDAFREVAEDLNALSDELYRKHGSQK